MDMLRSIIRRVIVQECKYIYILYLLGIYCFVCLACNLVSGVGFTMASNAKRSELNLRRNIVENFKNFEVQFDNYSIQANYRDITKDPVIKRDDYNKQLFLEISALRSALLDEALLVLG